MYKTQKASQKTKLKEQGRLNDRLLEALATLWA